jgi:AraC-like DNA-binding protein
MDYTLMPDKLLKEGEAKSKLRFVLYESEKPIVKGKSRLTQHMISLVTQGEKIIYSDGKPLEITAETVMLLSSGNYLFTERAENPLGVKSILIFFDDELLKNAVIKSEKLSQKDSPKAPYVVVAKDHYIQNYISTVQDLLSHDIFNEKLQAAKLNELLVYLYTKYPEEFNNFQNVSVIKTAEERVKMIAEQNIFNNLSVSELAFFCHMSLPTFKRKFQQLYHQPPAKWMQQQRLIAAASLLKKGSKPSEIYLEVGYENHSSFSHAFKDHFGQLPKDFI